MTNLKKIVRENLKRLLERDGFSQRDLANKIGVTEASVSNWISGRNSPKFSEIDKMIDRCNWSLAEIINGQDSSMSKILEIHNSSNSPFKISLK